MKGEEMFNNLIESTSHAREFKRRGSFVLFTSATYVLLFVVAGVMSIYAYDARLSDPSNELELISFVPPQPDKVVPEQIRVRPRAPAGAANGPRSMRPVLIDQTNNPLNPPEKVSAMASEIPPAHTGTISGPTVVEPSGPGRDGEDGDSNSNGSANVVVVRTPDPPPAPTPAPTPKRILTISTVLNGRALQLPKPPYPIIAKRMGVQGVVNVQVLIDETGKVISAKAISGNPALATAAQQAAFGARFSPTQLGQQAVKVSGVITYNFVLQ
jgi:periplasmic protein TonB